MANSALNAARAARLGVEAAQLARAGLTGPEQILEGRFGFLHLMSCDGDPAAIERSLGTHYRFLETSLKPYPTCRFTHGPIAALHTLNLRAADVESIELAAFRQSVEVSDRPQIRTRSEAILSHQYALALALTRERITLDDLDEAAYTRADLRALASRVRVVHDAELDPWQHRLTVRCRDGRTLAAESDFPPGGPQAPLDEQAVLAKCGARAGELRAAVWALETAPDVKGLIEHS